VFNPVRSLFKHATYDNHKLLIDPASSGKPGHLNHFKYIGRVLGLCIFHRCLLDAFFIVSFHKMIVKKKKVTLADLEMVDAELYHRMTGML
jgi:E3 ubiquitin-protein ligase NEDD4